MISESMQLLFFDTFSHENSDDYNLDLVQFPSPVCITEIRVIPLGTKVQADFPGGVRLGATNPSQFHVDFYVNNLTKSGAATFHPLGSLEYKHNVEIQLSCPSKIPTDGLVLRGFYTTITLAIYGGITKVVKEKQTTPPPASSSVAPVKVKNDSNDGEPESNDVDLNKSRSDDKKSNEKIVSGESATSHIKAHDSSKSTAATKKTQPTVDVLNEKSNKAVADVSSGSSETSRDDKSSSQSKENKEERRDSRSSDLAKGKRDSYGRDRGKERDSDRGRASDRNRERNRDVSGEKDWENDKDSKNTSNHSKDRQDGLTSFVHHHADSRSHTPPVRTRPPSPKNWRPRTPPSPHPLETTSVCQSSTPPAISTTITTTTTTTTTTSSTATTTTTTSTTHEDERVETLDESASGTQGELFEPLTPEASPQEPAEVLSDCEVHESGYSDYYEEILSEEEDMFEGEERIIEFQGELDYEVGEDAYVSSFNPFQCEFTPLMHFPDPSFTQMEEEAFKIAADKDEKITEKVQTAYEQLTSFVQQVDRESAPERWVEVLEAIPSLLVLASSKLQEKGSQSLIDSLVAWCSEALDFDLALQQPQAVYKVRQLKSGIKLSVALFSCNLKIFKKLFKADIQKSLLRLYCKDYMALSLKLLIVKALDASTRTKEGMLSFIGQLKDKDINDLNAVTDVASSTNEVDLCDLSGETSNTQVVLDETTSNLSCYQMLLKILLSKQSTRATVSITALLTKVHFYEVTDRFASLTENLANIISSTLTNCSKVDLCETDSQQQQQQQHRATEVDYADSQVLVNFSRDWSDTHKDELNDIALCLQEILFIYCTAQRDVAQPRRSLPVKAQFEIPSNPNNPYPQVYSLLNDCHFMESLLVLLTFPSTTLQPRLMSLVRDVIGKFLASQHGMLYLLSHTEVCNAILRILLQGSDDGREDVSDDNPLLQLGLQMVHNLQSLQCIDALLAEVQNVGGIGSKEIDDPDVLCNLHLLYTMTFSPLGRTAVINTLAAERNLESILLFLQPTNNEERDLKLRKSACIGYASELLLIVVKQSESVNLLKVFAEKLFTICNQELSTKIQELSHWLAPTRKLPSYDYQCLPQLCSVITASMEDVPNNAGELITALRILHSVCIPPARKSLVFDCNDAQVELKYKYVIVQLFANDMLAHFLVILQKLCDAHHYPVLHASSLVGQRGSMLVAIVKPIISMVMHIFSSLIECCNAEFKDMTSLKVLFQVYTLMSSFPSSSMQSSSVLQIQSDIIDTLLAFTQPVLNATESEEALSTSLWTKMVQEVLQYILLSPYVFVSGLTMFSELLPLPLPIHCQENLSTDQIMKAVNYRKIWSAHLHSLSSLIQDVIKTLGGTGDQTLQQFVRRICIQLADLSAPTSLVVVRGLSDAILDGLASFEDSSKDNFRQKHLSHLLNLLAILLSNGCIKASLLHLIRGESKIDKPYVELLQKLAKNLNFSISALQQSSEKTLCLQQIQEFIASVFQSLCDEEITLISPELQLPFCEQLANSLPTREQMSVICSALWDHLSVTSFGSPSVIICLRTLVMLTEHDYGMCHLKTCLDKKPLILHSILLVICSNFTKENPDFSSSLSTFLELLRLLVSLEDEGPQRTLEVSPSELAAYLKWENLETNKCAEPVVNTNEADSEKVVEESTSVVVAVEKLETPAATMPVANHPLQQLEKLLTDSGHEEESLESQALEHVQWIIQLLNENQQQVQPAAEKEWQEVVLPPAEKLLQQFSSRLNCLIGDVDEEALNSSFWLPQSGDDSDQETDQLVPCDLKALSEGYCPGLDFAAELGNMFLLKEERTGEKDRSKLPIGKRKYQPLINPATKEQPRKKPFIAPMRGRGYARGIVHSSRANDPFRSRPPNTSRPPSMHVDDFVAMEIFQPSTSVSSQSSKRMSKDANRGRVRNNFDSARDFATTRGRFIPATSGNYVRREERGRANVWTRGNVPPLPSSSQSSSKTSQKFGPVTPRSYLRPGHTEPRSEPRIQSTGRLTEGSAGRFSRPARGTSNSSSSSISVGGVALWPTSLRSKERDSRFPGTPGSQTRGRHETGRHTRAFTR